MASRKNINTLVGCVFVFFTGLGFGILMNDLPYITFKREVDLGTIISMLGLTATIFIMPFIVQKKLARQDNINAVILIDIEVILNQVERIKDIYVDLKSTSKIQKTKYSQILSLFKILSADILALSDELEKRGLLMDFKRKVYDAAFTSAKESCTETLIIDKKLSAEALIASHNSLNTLCSTLRTFRYETYK